ncbi:aromatic ring-opening dioxygenase LigA [Rhizobium sp. Root274]|uniref:DODA-type extradiol aromatic ring-opening family dioxygenase n=1 Tax=unclassified Rhizobium TaxID=2613769 RepID=UPI000713E849|nr:MULTISPECIES: class III extradiol ring-cleavage dioxygenase [unclassified Rhizobium]KQW30913.1 aromatic ring-opening dioxygenase LigA [Rhizobium sp. Root1240]KRD32457.1 aromatic ring-opening dioxygenase LigA [Rhizobium sp. Root274]
MTEQQRFPVYFIPHGGGPWPFMEFAKDEQGRRPWDDLGHFLRSLADEVGRRPKAILVVSGHWETEPVPTLSSAEQPGMLYDYYNFPPHTYELSYPAPGSPALAARARALLAAAGIDSAENAERGYDHGVFIPLMLAYPDADVPVTVMSLKNTLDLESHVAIGRALEPLRDEDVLIIASGMSYHNMRQFRQADPGHVQEAIRFDAWLKEAVENESPDERVSRLATWDQNPDALACHVPDHDHLVPLFVAAGAAGADAGRQVFQGHFLGKPYSGFRFG